MSLNSFAASLSNHVINHTIRKGDTLYSLVYKYRSTIKDIMKANGLKKGATLYIGKRLRVPINTCFTSKTISKQEIRMFRKLAKRYYSKNRKRFSKKGLRIISLAKQKLGKRYVWGAEGKNVFDCSGLTRYVCKKTGIKLPRRAIAQSKVGKWVSRKNLQKGDLIFFDTSKQRRGYVNHVGIYIGNNKFIHASSAKKRVVITSLNKRFYSRCFKGARRVAL
jgi:cell wall-associated NlpC family hydrolase